MLFAIDASGVTLWIYAPFMTRFLIDGDVLEP